MASRKELERRLAKPDADMPELKRHYADQGDFICEFSGHADHVMDHAGADDHAWAYGEIDRLLHKYGFTVVENPNSISTGDSGAEPST